VNNSDGIRPIYDADFYSAQSSSSYLSAMKMLSYLFECYRPRSVVDVGCGVGSWLSVARELGAEEVLGLDGECVDVGTLKIPKESFLATDLEQPLKIEHEADLCISVEVAEHLSAARAPALVRELTSLAPVVLFGAAIPGQGGVHHINLQWPAFWIDLFEQNGYSAIDCMRIPFWDDPGVDFWYAQNTLVYYDVQREDLRRTLAGLPNIEPAGLPLVHPNLYHSYLFDFEHGSLPKKAQQLRLALERAIGKRLGLGSRWGGPPPAPVRGSRAAHTQHG